ncbi:lipopolysaccharide kinase InaA family protein [Pseudomonas sp. UBA6562]|uniref:lipopolysaccharide kinase InaA family protein n=1 Tax=Pseudomonas sp. UBA6562 TaxID=1947332 RepID=UPI0025FE9596|nr:lipopolysaccharide kinase InaA family protein [Pseudomonas sp. UBA6562]
MASAHTPASQFDFYWQQKGEWVEEPNQRRGGESGVQRLDDGQGHCLYAKRQTGHLYRSWLHPFGRPTVLREQDALSNCARLGVRVPRIVFCQARRDANHQWQALLVSEALEGFVDLESWYAAGALTRYPEAVHQRMLKDLAQNMARMHRGHWQHSCLYGKHVFVKVVGEGEDAHVETALLDLEKARRRLRCQSAAAKDLGQLQRHSSISDAHFRSLLYFYETAFGSAVKGLGQ